MSSNVMTKKLGLIILGCVFAVSCVDHRPVRNGLQDEAIYLEKQELTQPNPKLGKDSTDDGWLYKVTVVKAASPNVLGDYAFPGYESDTKYVKFRFSEDNLQIVDGRALQKDDPNNPNDDLATTTPRVMMEFAGKHVDIKLAETLDGERTNLKEENTELPWQKRQKFKVDLEKTSLDPITAMAWFYGPYLHECARPVSAALVPGSFEHDKNDQYMSWVIEANYQLTIEGGCYDMISLANGVGTATIQYRMSFYRPGHSKYAELYPESERVVDEKAPSNKKYGVFQVQNLFRDSETEILSAKNFMQRWNPAREEPAVFYFHKGFPEKFKPMFQGIKDQTNQVLEQAGAKLRVDFREWNDGGIERHFGDIRYSFVVWHQDIDATRGLLGYGPSTSDPRTGEVLSANLNLYNIGMDYYRYLIQDYLEERGGLAKPDPAKPWEEIACTDGETTAPVERSLRLRSGLFDEMRRNLEIQQINEEDPSRDFIPAKIRTEDNAFYKDYHRILGEYRYVEPAYNAYVYRPTHELPLSQFKQRMAKEREFQGTMSRVLHGENPFGPVALSTRDGIKKQLEFRQQFQEWKKNHDRLKADQEFLLGLESISTFDANDAMTALSRSARRCINGRWESDDQYRDRIINNVVSHVAFHEFGHNLGLRHNFYGSVDKLHMEEGELSSTVMDYVAAQEEAGSPHGWGAYDKAALSWIYGKPEVREAMMKEDFLYCTDEHRSRSPLCAAHDLGVTPSEIALNAIERYDQLYDIRNKRAYRTFWDTSSYSSAIYGSIFPLQRLWYLGIFDWGGGGVQETLKRLDQIEGKVKTDQEYDAIAADFHNDIAAATDLITAYYASIVNQPSSLRNYQSEFDPYYGDILRMGIIVDKLYATVAFMDFQEVYNYNPNINTYVSMYDAPYGAKNAALATRVLDDMLGANYDTFPWFKYYATNIYASVTNSNLINNIEMRERIAFVRYESKARMYEDFGQEKADAAIDRKLNPEGVFVHNGEQYAVTNLMDRGWYIVANASRSPVSYEAIKQYNVALQNGSLDEDNYALKILLAYYEYFNNMSGY